MYRVVLLISIFVLAAGTAAATTHHIGKEGAAPAALEKAVRDAAAGDTILVYPGTYVQPTLNFAWGKDLVMKSVAGPEQTIFNAEGLGGIMLMARVSDKTVVDGFTFTNGQAMRTGGAIIIRLGASPVIRNCIFQSNNAVVGGAIYVDPKCAPTIENNLFVKNNAETWGGSIYAQHSKPTIRNNTFVANHSGRGGAGVSLFQTRAITENNLFIENTGTSVLFVMNDKTKGGFRCNAFHENDADVIEADKGGSTEMESVVQGAIPEFVEGSPFVLADRCSLKKSKGCGMIGWR